MVVFLSGVVLSFVTITLPQNEWCSLCAAEPVLPWSCWTGGDFWWEE